MKVIKSVLSIAVVATMFSCGNQLKEVKSLETEIDSVSYAIGLSMSGQLRSGFEEVNKDILTQAIRNGLDSTNLLGVLLNPSGAISDLTTEVSTSGLLDACFSNCFRKGLVIPFNNVPPTGIYSLAPNILAVPNKAAFAYSS